MLNFLAKCKLILSKIYRRTGSLCSIEAIDQQSTCAVVHFSGMCAPVKLRFDEIVFDVILISNLPPIHAAWIGYYYGLYQQQFSMLRRLNPYNFNFSHQSRYTILSLARNGQIALFDKKTNLTHHYQPKIMVNMRKLIQNLQPDQACYIGILAGISAAKQKKHESL